MCDTEKILSIPEGTEQISWWELDLQGVTTLVIPASLKTIPYLSGAAGSLKEILVAEGNPVITSIDGLLCSADGKTLYFCPPAREGRLVIPEGVTKIERGALGHLSRITSLSLPRSLQKLEAGNVIRGELESITVAEENAHFKCVDQILYDTAANALLCYPLKKGTDVTVPDWVTQVSLESFSSWSPEPFAIHLGANVEHLEWGSGNPNLTICAPAGSYAERYARRVGCGFAAEGEPVSVDDSEERKERSLKEWRLYFTISTRSSGLNISKYTRSSKIVYLPDVMGKAEVGTVDKNAFPPDVTILCSKRLFLKLTHHNRNATIRSFLTDPTLFTPEEKEYLLAYLKKNRAMYLELYIKNEDYDALKGCFQNMPKVKTLMEECLELTQRLNMPRMNFFLLQQRTASGGK